MQPKKRSVLKTLLLILLAIVIGRAIYGAWWGYTHAAEVIHDAGAAEKP